ncbi:MAG: dual specificity protein phosphatase family protein [Anaerolineae bacterium]|jgi:hypothetical protein
MNLLKPLRILWQRLTQQGVRTTFWWAMDHAVRIVTGAPIERVTRVAPQLYLGGQYRRRGWRRLEVRGVTAVVNMRVEFDDAAAGIAPARYLHLPTVDDEAPTLDNLRLGSEFIAEEIERGGVVYVHCGAGIGRAAIMAAAYLVTTGLTADEAWDHIRLSRPFIRPTPPQIEQLVRFAAAEHNEEASAVA